MNVGGGHNPLQSDINVTPLVDVVLVLLIIFMVIVPLTMRGYDIDIPGESSAPVQVNNDVEPAEQIVLAIDAGHCPVTRPVETEGLPGNCNVRINDDIVAVTELSQRVADTFAERTGSDRVLFLAAEDRLNYEGVMRILDVARANTADLRIGFVAER